MSHAVTKRPRWLVPDDNALQKAITRVRREFLDVNELCGYSVMLRKQRYQGQLNELVAVALLVISSKLLDVLVLFPQTMNILFDIPVTVIAQAELAIVNAMNWDIYIETPFQCIRLDSRDLREIILLCLITIGFEKYSAADIESACYVVMVESNQLIGLEHEIMNARAKACYDEFMACIVDSSRA